MKRNVVFTILVVILIVTNCGLLYQIRTSSGMMSNSLSAHYRDMKVINNYVESVGDRIPTDSLPPDTKLCLRYGQNACGQCVFDALALMESVFGKDSIISTLCIVGQGKSDLIGRPYTTIEYNGTFTSMDNVYTPYLCVLDSCGHVLFTLDLNPDFYEKNRKILFKLKEKLESKFDDMFN